MLKRHVTKIIIVAIVAAATVAISFSVTPPSQTTITKRAESSVTVEQIQQILKLVRHSK